MTNLKRVKVLFLLCILLLLCTSCTTSPDFYTDDIKIASEQCNYASTFQMQNIVGNEYRGDMGFEGLATLWSSSAEAYQEVPLSYFLGVTAGQAKLVLVTAEGDLTTITEVSADQEPEQQGTLSLPLQKGKNRLRLAALPGTRLTIQLQTNTGTFQMLDGQ